MSIFYVHTNSKFTEFIVHFSLSRLNEKLEDEEVEDEEVVSKRRITCSTSFAYGTSDSSMSSNLTLVNEVELRGLN